MNGDAVRAIKGDKLSLYKLFSFTLEAPWEKTAVGVSIIRETLLLPGLF